MRRWLLYFAVLGIVAAARPVSPLAEDKPSPERPECLARPASADHDRRGIFSGFAVSGVRMGRHPNKTRIVLDLIGKADFSYRIDGSGKMILLDLPGVDWRTARASRRKVGVVQGYIFNRESGGVGRLGVATSVPVRIKAAFRLPPNGSRGRRIVLDLVALDALGAFLEGGEIPGLVSSGKAVLLQGEGMLTEQEKAIESRFSPTPYLEKPTPYLEKIEPVRAVMSVPGPFMASPGKTRAKCPAFPRIPWWENDTHWKAVRYVNSRYGGDWNAYAAKWKKHLDKVANAFVERKKAFIKKANVTLKGKDYIDYINKIEKRISVIRCLARRDALARR